MKCMDKKKWLLLCHGHPLEGTPKNRSQKKLDRVINFNLTILITYKLFFLFLLQQISQQLSFILLFVGCHVAFTGKDNF